MTTRKAIITGISSFVGMHLAKAYAADGWDVCAITSRPASSYEGIRAARLATIKNDVELVQCDLMDKDAVGDLVSRHQPSVWLHHAAYADNYGSNDYDLEKSLSMNVVALAPLYQHLSKIDCGVIVTGSSMEYSSSDVANREDDACWPDMPYGISKLTQSVEAHRLSLRYNVPTRVARLYIPVGTFDAPGKLIGSVIGSLLKGDSVGLSPCTQKRDFLGVDDITSAYLKLTNDFSRQLFDVFNVCSGEAQQLRELIEALARIIGADSELLDFGAREMRPGEPMLSYGDNQKFRDTLHWHPSSLDETLRKLVDEVKCAE